MTLPTADQELVLPPAQIGELMQLLSKALRAHQLYLPNNPVYQSAIEHLRQGFRKVWEATDDLVLDVSEAELKWEGHVVHSAASRSDSIAWVLFKDGVRSVTFLPGVEETEIVGLLDVIHRARTLGAEDSDDLLTLLWEKDFQRFQYVFQDLMTDQGAPLPSADEIEPPRTPPARVQQVVEEEAPPKREGIVSAEDFDTTLYFLDEKEIEWIRRAVQDEYTQDLRRNVLAMLFDVLELQPYPTVRQELIGIVENFLPYLLGASDFRAVGYVLREVRSVLQRARELTPEHRQALDQFPARLSDPQALAQLVQALDESTALPGADELAELFNELRGEALPTLFEWLPRLTNARVRDVVESAVQRLAAANAATVAAAMASPDVNAAAAAVHVASRLKLAACVPALVQALERPQTPLRAAAVAALAEIATPAALQGIEKGLEDADRDVRLAAIRVIGQQKVRSALPTITAVVQGKSMRAADLTEKMAFFEAYGLMVGESGVEPLDAVLNSGGFLKRKEDPQTRACAAMALGRIGTASARAALEKAAQDKEPLVRNAVTRALRGDRASTMLRAGELPS